MCAKGWATVLVLLSVACGGSDASAPDADPGVNSSRASRGGGLPDALASNLDGAGTDGATPPSVGGSGGGGAGAGSGGVGMSGGAGGSGGAAVDAPAPGEVGPDLAGPSACEQGGVCERLNKE